MTQDLHPTNDGDEFSNFIRDLEDFANDPVRQKKWLESEKILDELLKFDQASTVTELQNKLWGAKTSWLDPRTNTRHEFRTYTLKKNRYNERIVDYTYYFSIDGRNVLERDEKSNSQKNILSYYRSYFLLFVRRLKQVLRDNKNFEINRVDQSFL